MLSQIEIERELAKSARWGVNTQPPDLHEFAKALAGLPCAVIQMKKPDTCIIRFDYSLSEEEAAALRKAANLELEDENPFEDGGAKTEVLLWWD